MDTLRCAASCTEANCTLDEEALGEGGAGGMSGVRKGAVGEGVKAWVKPTIQ